LDLSSTRAREDGVVALLESPHFPDLQRLALEDNALTLSPRTIAALAKRRLRSLVLGYNRIAGAQLRAFAACPGLGELRRLDLNATDLTAIGVRHLARSAHLARLRWLDLSWTGCADDGASALSNSPHLSSLTTLDLAGNQLTAAGF